MTIRDWTRRTARIFCHGQNLNDRPGGGHGHWLRNSRAWLHIGRVVLAVEFGFPFRWRALAAEIDVMADEHDVQLSLSSPVAHLYLTVSGVLPYRWPRRWGGFRTGAAFHGGSLWLRLLHPDTGSWSSKDRWWQRRELVLHVQDRIRGRAVYSTRILAGALAVIPMPEGVYYAKALTEESIWRYPRWPTLRRVSVRIVIDKERHRGAIPFPGKGENSWDCGIDGLYEASHEGDSVPEAIGHFVGAVLGYRHRYGGASWHPRDADHTAVRR